MQVDYIPGVEILSPLVIRVLGMNPGPMTHEGTNTYIIGSGKNRILLDCGQGKKQYKENLTRIIELQKFKISDIVISHHHYDHTQGIQDVIQMFPDVRIYKSLQFNLEVDKQIQQEYNFQYHDIENDKIFEQEEFSLKAIQTPGHTKDHFSFYLTQEKILFTGDCLLGGTSTVIEDLKSYLESLLKLQTYEVHKIFPGHGYNFIGSEICQQALEKQRNHRLLREQQILKVFQQNSKVHINDIFKLVYPEIKDPQLERSAKFNIRVHLEKLNQDGVTDQLEEDIYFIKE